MSDALELIWEQLPDNQWLDRDQLADILFANEAGGKPRGLDRDMWFETYSTWLVTGGWVHCRRNAKRSTRRRVWLEWCKVPRGHVRLLADRDEAENEARALQSQVTSDFDAAFELAMARRIARRQAEGKEATA